ncbi:MAG: AfsR/SARP family transcriptional regulator [Pseudonocardiaceae bacterium]
MVSRLRAALPAEAVISSGPGYYQFTGEVWADVEQIDTELDAAQRALARGDSAGARDSAATAVELARQPLLPGYVGEWLDARREQLRGSLITGLEVLARAAEPAAAVRHAAEALALEPFRESVYQLLIDAHLAAGNRAEALRAYQRCRDVLGTRRGPVAEDAAVLSAGAGTGRTGAWPIRRAAGGVGPAASPGRQPHAAGTRHGRAGDR